MRVRFLCLAMVCLPLAAGCATEKFQIGRGVPEQEIEKCMALSAKKHFEEAIQCLEIFKSRFPGSAEGQEAELRIADNHYQRKEYLLAAETYEAFIKLHPSHPKVDYALYRVGLSHVQAGPKAIDRDQGYLQDALAAVETMLAEFPQSPFAEAARQQRTAIRGRIGRRHFYVGNFYFRTGEYRAAIPRFMEVLQAYPEVGRAEEAAGKVVAAAARIGLLEEAKTVYAKMIEAFPRSPWTKRAERLLLRAAASAANIRTAPKTRP
ncbi:MAG: outer membrane protein assembly factor BamD [Deltaproteobacteria bacterium]|nr:outer membrane protein assembly factor BamD [Deltaproteobacteria bacterium]